MASINQTSKSDYSALKIDYTDRDYTNILNDLIDSIPGITQKWKSSEDENDPGIVLVKLMAMIADLLNFELDMQSLEVYPNSVTQRKNAATIYKLIGYKMDWYESAELTANVINTYTMGATMPRFCTFTTQSEDITYTTWEQYELPSNTTNNGLETTITLVQGIPVTPVRASTRPYPETGKPWHSIYGYNYSADNIINNRLYLNDRNIDQSHIIVVDDKNDTWTLKDNIYTTTDVGKFFQFDVDGNDNPYIELVDYWKNFNVTKFKIFYILSSGEAGQVYANTLKNLTGNVWARESTAEDANVYNISNFIHFTHYDSTYGYDPETPDEARKNAPLFQNTLDTLITLADFERATLREPGVANVRATDLTNDPGTVLNYYVGDINMDGVITQEDYVALQNYLADPNTYPLSSYQKELADCNQSGGNLTTDDLKCLYNYLNKISDPNSKVGLVKLSQTQLLNGFTVKLYIARTEQYEDLDEPTYKSIITTDLQQYKILPLTIDVDLDSIKRYYWTIEGKFITQEPLSRDELQTIIVNINNDLKHKYSISKVNFNTIVNYKQIIDTILAVDPRIEMVDLEPIKYVDEENNVVPKEAITGQYIQTIPRQFVLTSDTTIIINKNYYTRSGDGSDNNPFVYTLVSSPVAGELANYYEDLLEYTINIENTPILPNSLMIRLDNGLYVLRDDGNGKIYNTDNILGSTSTINYTTGKLVLKLSAPLTSDLIINYTKNEATLATYSNLNTNSFYFDSSSLSTSDVVSQI